MHDTFWMQGFNGRFWPASINPYKPGTPRHRAWMAGWRNGRKTKPKDHWLSRKRRIVR